jgi:hypothetical protein
MAEIAIPENIISRLSSIEAVQMAMNTAIGLIIDTLQMQTNLLGELADLARDEPGPSPILQSIDDLTSAVEEMGSNVEAMGVMLADLPAKIGDAIDESKLGSSP